MDGFLSITGAISRFRIIENGKYLNFEANSLSKSCFGKANDVMCALNTFFALKLTGPEVVLKLSTLGFQSAN